MAATVSRVDPVPYPLTPAEWRHWQLLLESLAPPARQGLERFIREASVTAPDAGPPENRAG